MFKLDFPNVRAKRFLYCNETAQLSYRSHSEGIYKRSIFQLHVDIHIAVDFEADPSRG